MNKHSLSEYVYDNNSYLVHIIEGKESDYPHLYYHTKSYHVAKVIAHDYISSLESYYGNKISINTENYIEHPSLIENITLNITDKTMGKDTIHIEIHKIKTVKCAF
jgi:hypothetical protein